jgi:N4-gp56 family major capsid protein
MATVTNQTYTNVASQNQLTAENAEYYQKVLLKRLTPELKLFNYGQKGMGIPKHAGDNCSWRKFGNLPLQTTPLVEGVTPDSMNASVSKITAAVKQYGGYIVTTDYLDTVALDPVVQELTELIGENGGQSLETVVRDIVNAGTNVYYANGRTARNLVTATDKITIADILKIRRNFKRNYVKPIGDSYICLCHVDVLTDLIQTQEWKDQNTYVSTSNRESGEIGRMYGIKFIEYDFAAKFTGAGATGIDVYSCLFLGRDAFGVVDIEGSQKPEIIVKPLGSSGVGDALNQRASVGRTLQLVA